jgi:hypothetical protein
MPRYVFQLSLFDYFYLFPSLCYFVHQLLAYIIKAKTCLIVYVVKSVIIAKELRKNLPSPLYNVKQLKLKAYSSSTKQIYELVDAMLWICPLLEILFIEWSYQNTMDNILFKVLHMFISWNLNT